MFSRWKVEDPARGDVFTFRLNPDKAEDEFPARAITATPNALGTRMFAIEGATPSVPWAWSGMMLAKSQFDELYDWVYGKNPQRGLVKVTNHVGMVYVGYLTKLTATEARTSARYPYKRYVTVNMLLVALPTKPTMPDTEMGAAWG